MTAPKTIPANWSNDGWNGPISPCGTIGQANQGKFAAHNKAIGCASGYFFVLLDSDDTLLPQALERFDFHWRSIPDDQKDGFAGVEGLCLEEITLYSSLTGRYIRFKYHSKFVRYSLHCKVGLRQQYAEIRSKFYWIISVPRGIIGWLEDKIRMTLKAY
jgi:glycosyltransferase involved in cell wall biosynthesis